MKRATLGIMVLWLVLPGCSSGPEQVADGSYTFFAGSQVGDGTGTLLEVSGEELTLVSGDGTTEATMTFGDATFVLCPPDVEGAPNPISGSIEIGGVTLSRPAIFGDCGETSPVRVTVVDLDRIAEDSLPQFAVWAEFCDVTDPDC